MGKGVPYPSLANLSRRSPPSAGRLYSYTFPVCPAAVEETEDEALANIKVAIRENVEGLKTGRETIESRVGSRVLR